MSVANNHLLAEALSTAELVGSGAVRFLDLRRKIDTTIDSLAHHTELLRTAERAFVRAKNAICSGDHSKAIPEKDIIPVLESLQDSLMKAHSESNQKMSCALNDPRLSDEDGVADGYAIFLDALVSLNHTAESLRWAILESNADAEGPHTPKLLSAPSDIDAFLDTL